MIIRGVDFARHNIVIGSADEHPAPAQGRLTADRGVIEARVISTSGREATIEVGGQRVVVETHVPLNAGDKLFVKVAEAQGNAIRLAIVASAPEDGVAPPLPDAEVETLLRELGLPTDARTRHAARALLARDGAIDKEQLAKLQTALRQLPDVTGREAGAAALLQKSSMPINATTVATILARSEPSAPPQLGAQLSALGSQLQALRQKLGGRSALGPQLDDMLATLKGLPLDEQATSPRVAAAVRQWIDQLTPSSAKDRQTLALPGMPGAEGDIKSAAASVRSLLGLPPLPEGGDVAGPNNNPEPRPAATPNPLATPQDSGKRGMERLGGVPASQNSAETPGISNVIRHATGPDLAARLERLASALGQDQQGLKKMIGEAVAEVRYIQLSNGPMPTNTDPVRGPEYMVPLLVPQLNQDHPEGKLQIFHKPSKPGEPIDPQNVRLVFVLDTEHLRTVQAEVAIKDGVVNVTIGVPDGDDRQFLADHLDELEEGITQLGWATGRFLARQARALPPRTRQEEGLGDVVRFDRRV